MNLKLIGLCTCLAVFVTATPGCSILTPGNEGWQCKKSKDCKGKLRCRTYKFKGRKHMRKYCTGRKALTSSKQTYNWFLLVGGWLMIVGLPLLVVVLVVVGRRKKKKQDAAQPPAGAGPPGGASPPSGAPPPTEPPAA